LAISNKLKIISLGGIGEIGKNITAFEYKDEIILIDCGLTFPDEEMYGVDIVIPDITYLKNKKEKVKGIFLTHGHEDHIGAIPYFLKQINVPIYGTRLTLGLVENKLREHNILSESKLNVVAPKDIIGTEFFKVEFIRNSHSIADSCSLAIHTPLGIIVHSGDFKVDFTPIDGDVIDLSRFAELGDEGVLLMFADSTNAEREGYTMSEKNVGETLLRTFGQAQGRIIVATFASNIHRLQQIIDASVEHGRKVAVSGRSMENVSQVAIDLGYLKVPEGTLISIDDISKYQNKRVTVITTGSQGEPMSALARMASATHRKLQIQKDDLVIISASPIPGNQKFISKVINQLFKQGANVIYESIEEIHVSGHACQEELKLLQNLVRPKYFVPVHGEYRHLKHHSLLAQKMGIDKDNIFLLEIGQVLEISSKGAKISGTVPSGKVLVDGLGVGDVGNIVLRDRKQLAQDGIITVVVTIDKQSASILAGPDIVSRGFVYIRESEALMSEARDVVKKALERCLDNNLTEWAVIKNSIRNELKEHLYIKTKRKPIILPIIMEV
jgi:ribonuclease J